MTLSSGSRLGPYEVLSPLGKGGMGEVYRARDPRLARDVAIKVLPEEFFEGEERRQRFEREARLLAALNHPGIAAIYSFEEIPSSSSSSRHLLVMELVEGKGLDQRIAAGALSLEEILSYSRQIAEALAAAHEKGIVHRDLKPANVRLTPGGRVKLLDFGLAKRTDEPPAGSEDATATAALSEAGAADGDGPLHVARAGLGPSARREDGPLLARDRPVRDGVRPAPVRGRFLGRARVRDPARHAAARGPDPRGPAGALADAIGRCLEKDPRSRFSSARDLLTAFDAPRRGAPSPVSIAVLPFADMSSAKDQEYLCEGMAEEIMNALVGAGIRVAARMSTFRAARQGRNWRRSHAF